MSLVGFRAQNHPQQTAKPEGDDRQTAPEHFDPLHARFGFTIDVAATPENAKLPRFYTVLEDGLTQTWAGERVWCNPPYSSIEPWLVKAWREFECEDYGESNPPALIVMLLPANRCEQGWWQRHVEPRREERATRGLHVEFLPGRMRFIRTGSTEVGPNERPPFGCCLLIWGES